MTNIQLYVENQLCDFDSKTNLNLQKEFEDETELIVKEIEYSYTMSIPTSPKNKKIFGYIDDFDVANKFSKIYNAELYINEILILRGKLKLTEIDSEYFKGNLYNPASQTVSDILGDRQLNEIQEHLKPMNNMKDYTEQNNYVMGFTNNIPAEKYRDNHICYPYILYKLPLNEAEAAMQDNLDHYTQNLAYGKHTIGVNTVFPSYNVLSVIKDMFATEGYNVQGNIFGDEKFKDLYQTFQYDYSKYLEERESPYYLEFKCDYTNITNIDTSGLPLHPMSADIPTTLQTCTMWSENGYYGDDGDERQYFDGSYKAGVDAPLVAGEKFTKLKVISNDQHMLTKGTEYDGYGIVVPKSGWYRIHCDGSMNYPILQSQIMAAGPMLMKLNVFENENTETVGGMIDERDNTSLEQQPFEFQIKKGYPMESPQLYSFNSGIPCMPTHYAQFDTVCSYDYTSAVKVPSNDRQSYYGKNGGATIIKDYSDKPISDFIAGARLGGALFSKVYDAEYYGPMQSPNRFALMGELMALPRADKNLTFKEYNNQRYFQMSNDYYCEDFEYSKNTAQVLVRDDSYSEFDGYNKVNFETGAWDRTTNYNSRHYTFDSSETSQNKTNSASTNGSSSSGTWEINTVVWLEKGENIQFEVVMPYHYGGRYTCCHSEWTNSTEWINATMVSFNYKMAFINSDKTWYPNSSSPIPLFNDLSKDKETNVNKFLPTIKCNDYLNKFLQTFNLQLTMPYKNTFSIDAVTMNNIMGNVISIDGLANIKDAEFKALDLPSTRQLTWKIDKSETGYFHGNQSPYKDGDYPWYESGYTGGVSITNDTNTSGSIDKKESQWSYNWYKNIKFLNGNGLSVSGAPISVISDKNTWDSETTYYNVASDNPKTSSTMRLFFLGKNVDTDMYNFIQFKYDELNGEDMWGKLIIPSNSITTKQSNGNKRQYVLDYDNQLKATHPSLKTITDIFFNLYVQTGYQIDIPIKLSNDLYNKIKYGTLIQFNDGLYKIKSIEGHDCNERENGTMSLLTLK